MNLHHPGGGDYPGNGTTLSFPTALQTSPGMSTINMAQSLPNPDRGKNMKPEQHDAVWRGGATLQNVPVQVEPCVRTSGVDAGVHEGGHAEVGQDEEEDHAIVERHGGGDDL